ncbi:yiaA/B two helix domain protein [Burkholderia thailandensis MSMB121]|nr:yiaA/B two helix domain protein [Burkholderia thailandensis MSMB121]
MHSEKGFYAMAFALALFGSVAVQKNTRDIETAGRGRAETAIAADAAE